MFASALFSSAPSVILVNTVKTNLYAFKYVYVLKGPWHEIFDLWFFSPINPT
jgi:hypothetical protein